MGDPRTLIRGQKLYRDLTNNFSFWRPLNWHQTQLDTPPGVMVYPEADPRTGFYVRAVDLDHEAGEISHHDLPMLREGLVEGLRSLPDCAILSEQEIVKEEAFGLEFLLTFALAGASYKQRLRVLYTGGRQYTLYGQGTPIEDYDVFANIFDYIYLTFRFGDLLLDMGAPPMPGMEPHYFPPDS